MEKVFRLLFIALVTLASCSRKTQPVASTPYKTTLPSTYIRSEKHFDTPVSANPVSTAAPITAIKLYSSPMVVIDEKGSIITSRDNLPDEIAAKVNYKQIARSFTPAQRTNLIYRFKMVPPRVLFVPKELAQHSTKGYYCIYKKKFWYWKKEDGLFYLADTYYQ